MTDKIKRSSNCLSADPLLVAPLDCFRGTDLELAGGKAANLGELVQAGFPVPPGFTVTTAAYEAFVSHSNLQKVVAQVLLAEPVREPQRDGGAVIRTAFETAPIPPDVTQRILAAYQQLGKGPVAVRSSATAEDLPGASFAGQQDTYLNIVDGTALLDAVRRCWASLWTDRAISYRSNQGIDPLTVRLAVVVQQMVAAEVAGVMFTASPVTGDRDETIIDASPGLGEAIVSGLVTPDHFVLRRQRGGWRITERRVGQREVIIQARSGGGTEHRMAPVNADGPALSDAALRQLARYGAGIQRHFGRPQDIEWAWAGGKPFILQARPITALPEPPPHANLLQRQVVNNFAEMLPIRPYPLDLDTWMPALGGGVEPMFELLGLNWRLNDMFEGEDGVVAHYLPHLPHLTWRTLLAPARLVASILRYNPRRWQADPLLANTITRAQVLEAQPLDKLNWAQLLEIVYEAKAIPYFTAGAIRRRYFPGAALATVRLRLLLGLLGQSKQFGPLLAGVENKTLEMNHALEQLAGHVRSDPVLAQSFARHTPDQLLALLEAQPNGRAFLIDLRAFFDRYGHRETVISTALEPTWKAAPDIVLGIIKGMAAHPPQLQSRTSDWQAARDTVLQHPIMRLAPLRSAFLETLARARLLLQIREDTHFYMTLAMPVFRQTLLEMGRRLASMGVIDSAEDIFHLRLAELEQVDSLPLPADLAAQLHAAVTRRKTERAKLEAIPPVDPRLFARPAGEGDVLLHGIAGSPGVVEGPVRIIREIAEFDRLAAGEVLVAPYTNPAWTPLFQRAAAVIVDTGSPVSHAAIVAREYGIPAVMATLTGTHTLQDGERVRVDGSQGVVYRASSQAAASEG